MNNEIEQVLPLEEADTFAAANPVSNDGLVVIDQEKNEAREDAQLRILLNGAPLSVVILGGAHDLTNNIKANARCQCRVPSCRMSSLETSNWGGLMATKPTRALSIRQPHAEAIMRGKKKIEYRSKATKIRGRIFIYASRGRYKKDDEKAMMAQYGIKDVVCDELPRGVIIGTVDLHDCDQGDWHLKSPERAKRLRKSANHPQPVWFKPF